MKTVPIISYILAACLLFSCEGKDSYISISGYAQGGTYMVKLNLKGVEGRLKEKPENIKTAIDSLLLEIDNSLSGYNKGSLLSRFNRMESIKPDSIFKEIYALSYRFWQESEGALDVASGRLFDIWGFGFTADSLPSEKKILETLDRGGMKRMKPGIEEALDENGILHPLSMLKNQDNNGQESLYPPVLNFNAVAQGYSCDLVASYLYSIGVKDMLVEIGEIFCDGLNPSGQAWNIGVDMPSDGNNEPGKELKGFIRSNGGPCGIVTSGNYRKFYIKDGKKYSHTIDPRTGYPVSHNLLSATIVAEDAATADAWATRCMVIGLEASINAIENNEGIEGYLIYNEDGQMKTWASAGLILNQ